MDKTLKTITVGNLMDLLGDYDPETPVIFTTDYGDHGHTAQALPLKGHAEEVLVTPTAYSNSGFAIDREEFAPKGTTGGLSREDVATGKPIDATFYRGTATGANESEYAWFTTDEAEAKRYAEAAATRSQSAPVVNTYRLKLANPFETKKGTEILNAQLSTLKRLRVDGFDAMVYWHSGGIAVKSNPNPTPRVWVFKEFVK